MTDTTDRDDSARAKAVERVRKLLAKAINDASTEAESQAFEAKAMAMMAEWEIAEREIADGGGSMGTDQIDLSSWGRATYGVAVLYSGLATLMGGYATWFAATSTVRLHGTEAVRERVRLMADHLAPQLRTDLIIERPRSKRDFAIWWAETVHARLADAQAVAYSESNALVPTSAAAEAYARANGKIRKGRARTMVDGASAEAGRQAGLEADLRQERLA